MAAISQSPQSPRCEPIDGHPTLLMVADANPAQMGSRTTRPLAADAHVAVATRFEESGLIFPLGDSATADHDDTAAALGSAGGAADRHDGAGMGSGKGNPWPDG